MIPSDIKIIDTTPEDSAGINAVTEAVWLDSCPNDTAGITEK